MKRTSVSDVNCSIAQCLEVIGDWWTMLIVRDLLLGVRRFDEIQERLGISRNVLTQRLDLLVEQGVAERRLYQERPPRYDYVLTERGLDLWIVVQAMKQWGDKWAAPKGAPVELLHRTCGHHTTMQPACSECGGALDIDNVWSVPGPGSTEDDCPLPRRLIERARGLDQKPRRHTPARTRSRKA